MPFVSSNQLSNAEAEDYMRVFHATVNVLTNAVVAFDSRSRADPDPLERERCRGAALEANRQLQLVQAKLAAAMGGTAQVRAPTPSEVSTAQGLTRKLAEHLAAQAKATALVKIVSKAVATFAKINTSESPTGADTTGSGSAPSPGAPGGAPE